MEYIKNDEAEALAVEIIKENHPHLIGCKIAYIAKVKDSKRKAAVREGKKITMARTSMVSPKMQALFELEGKDPYVFIIDFEDDIWQELSEEAKKALVDHELYHCGNDADGYYLRSHQLEEFGLVVGRHGAWKSDIKQFLNDAVPQGAFNG